VIHRQIVKKIWKKTITTSFTDWYRLLERADDSSGNQRRLSMGRAISGGDLHERVQEWSSGQYHGATPDILRTVETIRNLLSRRRNATILPMDNGGAPKRRHRYIGNQARNRSPRSIWVS
jgi:hypothetical protein